MTYFMISPNDLTSLNVCILLITSAVKSDLV